MEGVDYSYKSEDIGHIHSKYGYQFIRWRIFNIAHQISYLLTNSLEMTALNSQEVTDQLVAATV